jgi:hypothetical protein
MDRHRSQKQVARSSQLMESHVIVANVGLHCANGREWGQSGERRPSRSRAARQTRRVLYWAGLLTLLCMCWSVSKASAAGDAPPLRWASPLTVDEQPPFAFGPNIGGMSCPAVDMCIGGNNLGDVVTSSDPTGGESAWRVTHIAGAGSIDSVSCPSTKLCVAVDDEGNLLTSTDPLGGASAWSIAHVGGVPSLSGVSCPSSKLCVAVGVAVGPAGRILTATEPTHGAAAWSVVELAGITSLSGVSCASEQLCVAVSRDGETVTSTDPIGGASAWSAVHPEGAEALADVSCPTEELCVASGMGDQLVSSTDPTAGASAWSVTQLSLGYASLRGIFCATGEFCIALAGEEVLTSTDPMGGAGAWTSATVDARSLDAISCVAESLCVVGDNGGAVVTSTDPLGGGGVWSTQQLDVGWNVPAGISCASLQLCVAIDDGGNVVASTDPTGGAAAWVHSHVDSSGGLEGISCPSASLCVAVDEVGDVVTSTDPAGGSGAWRVLDVDSTKQLTHVSCPSTKLCVAIDAEGDTVISTDPTGGADAWSETYLAPDLTGVSCPTEKLCVLADSEGDIFASSDPAADPPTWSLNQVGAGSQLACYSASLCVTVEGGLAWGDPSSTAPWAQTGLAFDEEEAGALREVTCSLEGMCLAMNFGNGSRGNVISTADPADGAAAWGESNIYGLPIEPSNQIVPLIPHEVAGLSCVQQELCVVVDLKGRVMVGTAPPAGSTLPPVSETPAPPGGGGLTGLAGGRAPGAQDGSVSNLFKLTGVTVRSGHGAVALTLSLPGPGALQIVGTASAAQLGAAARARGGAKTLLIAQTHLTASAGGSLVATLLPTARARAILARRGALTASVTITYTPRGGAPRSIVRTIGFRMARRH